MSSMRKFVVLTKDGVTGLQMILSEVSFNHACSFLENEKGLGEFIGTDDVTVKGRKLTKVGFSKRDFFYDEERGYLLGK